MIKKADIISSIILFSGLLILATDIVLQIKESERLFEYWIVGVIFIPISIILASISGLSRTRNSYHQASSLITPLYKIVLIPIMTGMTLLFVAGIVGTLLSDFPNELAVPLLIFAIVSGIYNTRIIEAVIQMKWVKYDNEKIVYLGLKEKNEKSISEIIGISKTVNGLFYRIEFNDKSKITILAKLSEKFDSLGGEPKSIARLRKISQVEKQEDLFDFTKRNIFKMFQK